MTVTPEWHGIAHHRCSRANVLFTVGICVQTNVVSRDHAKRPSMLADASWPTHVSLVEQSPRYTIVGTKAN